MKMTDERFAEILNHVSETWVDLKQTDFAGKAELCEAILMQSKKCDHALNKAREVRGDTALKLLELANLNLAPLNLD